MNYLAQASKDIVGKISPPPGLGSFTDPISGLSNILTFGIRLFFVIAGLSALFFALRGGLDWVTSGGDKEKISAAQQRITNALIGLVLIVVILGIFFTLEQVVFQKKFCFGLSCGIKIPQL